MRRKYTTDLMINGRIDLFIEENIRLITKIKSIAEGKIILDLDPKTNSINLDRDIYSQNTYKATYYNGQEVYLFHALATHISSDKRYITLKRPLDFYKVKRRQHVRGTWFSTVQYIETNSIDRFILSEEGQLYKGRETAQFKKQGYLLNLSGGGVELKLNEPVNTEFIIIKFKNNNEFLTYYGVIRRQSIVKELGTPTYRIGIEFINLSDEVREKTIKIVFEKMRQIQRKTVI